MTPDKPDARIVRVEAEVPATPEQVWEAIATGPGIACWFVPAEVEEREGGSITTHHGPYGDSTGVVTAWDPPHRFAYEEREWQPPEADAPPWATEILVEARAGGTSVVRLSSGLFSNAGDWAAEIDGTESGWRQGIEHLRLYLTHFAGQRCTQLWVAGAVSQTQEEAWRDLIAALGLHSAATGQRVSAAPGAPALAGIVESVSGDTIVLRTGEPGPGVVDVYAHTFGGQVHVGVRAYLYGDDAAAVAAREDPAWRAWMAERYELLERAGEPLA